VVAPIFKVLMNQNRPAFRRGRHNEGIMSEVSLVEICFLQFGLSACIDNDGHKGISLSDVKDALQGDNLFDWMKAKDLPGDYSMFVGERDALGRELSKLLQGEDQAFAGRERRKLGIENNGICYLLSLTVELVQSLQWRDPRLPAGTKH